MTFREKLANLKQLQDVVLFKWTAPQYRIAENYILLSDIRLMSVTCDNNSVIFSSAAPILFRERNRTLITFKDSDVMTITDGQRKGINVSGKFLKQGESASTCCHCESRVLDACDKVPKWLESKILSMGCSPAYPVSRIVMPELFRISKKPATLKPVFNTEFIEALGASRDSTTEELLQMFHDKLDIFGHYTDAGYVISNDYISTGGCCVCSARGITARSGSAVHKMTKRAFEADIDRRHWQITTRVKEQ